MHHPQSYCGVRWCYSTPPALWVCYCSRAWARVSEAFRYCCPPALYLQEHTCCQAPATHFDACLWRHTTWAATPSRAVALWRWSHSSPSLPCVPRCCCTLPAGTNLLPGPSYPLRQALVEAHHLGCYALKGCGTVEVVTFLTDTIPVLEWPRAEASKGSKGTLLSAASGPVVGLQGCPVALPAVLPALRRAWRVAGGVAAAAAVGRGGD